MSIITENTRRIIYEKGFKQSAIARKAGYSEKKFSDMMCGRKTITSEDVIPISAALDVTPNDLFRQTIDTVRKEAIG